MPDLEVTPGHLGRPRLHLPPVTAINCFTESSPSGPAKSVRSSRPGLTLSFTIGSGPILRSFQQPGVFNGDVFNVSGGGLYRGSTLLGDVAYSQAPRFAAAQQFLALVSGGALYIYDGTTLTPQTLFDDGVSPLPAFSGVAVLYNIWIYPVVGSNQFFFSSPGNPGVINAANFGAAQTSPTPIVEVATLAEELYFFKTANGIEIWDFEGALTAPFQESAGRTYAKGCSAQNSVCQLDNSLFWVGDDFVVYRTSTVPLRVSTSLIEDRLKAEADLGSISAITALSISGMEGHVYYVVNLPSLNESYAYDCQTQQWFRWGTQGALEDDPGVWLGRTCAGQGNQLYIGSNVDGRVFLLDETNHSDDGIPLRVVLGAAHWLEEGVYRANNLAMQMVRGVATVTDPDPIVGMRWTEDGGQTFTSWRYGEIGPVGGYRYKVSWHSLGLIRQPGREFEFFVSDTVNVTVESVTLNPSRR